MKTSSLRRARSINRTLVAQAFDEVLADPNWKQLIHLDFERPQESMSIDAVLPVIKKVEMLRAKDRTRELHAVVEDVVTTYPLADRCEGYRIITLRYYSILSSLAAKRRRRTNAKTKRVKRVRAAPPPLELTA